MKTKRWKVQWFKEVEEGEQSYGFWTSVEGRFEISPCYGGRTTPISYFLTDRLHDFKQVGSDRVALTQCAERETVRECKQLAEAWLEHERRHL